MWFGHQCVLLFHIHETLPPMARTYKQQLPPHQWPCRCDVTQSHAGWRERSLSSQSKKGKCPGSKGRWNVLDPPSLSEEHLPGDRKQLTHWPQNLFIDNIRKIHSVTLSPPSSSICWMSPVRAQADPNTSGILRENGFLFFLWISECLQIVIYVTCVWCFPLQCSFKLEIVISLFRVTVTSLFNVM